MYLRFCANSECAITEPMLMRQCDLGDDRSVYWSPCLACRHTLYCSRACKARDHRRHAPECTRICRHFWRVRHFGHSDVDRTDVHSDMHRSPDVSYCHLC